MNGQRSLASLLGRFVPFCLAALLHVGFAVLLLRAEHPTPSLIVPITFDVIASRNILVQVPPVPEKKPKLPEKKPTTPKRKLSPKRGGSTPSSRQVVRNPDPQNTTLPKNPPVNTDPIDPSRPNSNPQRPGFNPFLSPGDLSKVLPPGPGSSTRGSFPGLENLHGSETVVDAPDKEDYPLSTDDKGRLVYEGSSFSAVISKDGSVSFNSHDVSYQAGSVAFDVSDLLDKASGHDPHSAAKQRFLKKTQERREAMRKEAQRTLFLQEKVRVRLKARQIWSSESLPELRRRALFEYWMSRGDEKEPSLSAAARSEIEAFIRTQLPIGGPFAYTQEELTQLNQELQNQGFAISFRPYAT